MITLLKRYLAALVSGVTLALCFPTWHLYPLAWVALVPLLLKLRHAHPSECFRQFLIAGWVFNLVVLQWLMSNIYWVGGWGVWGYVLLSLFMALYWGIVGYLWARIRQWRPALGPLALALLWAAMEYLQATLFTGFGWTALAYSQGPDLPLLQWAALGGEPIISFWLVLVNALLAHCLTQPRRRWPAALVTLAVLIAVHAIGYALIQPPQFGATPFSAGIVQANFPLEMKWDWEYTDDMVRNSAQKSRWLAQNRKVDLLVWPESLIMDSISRPAIHKTITDLCRETHCALFTGAVRDTTHGGELNSSYLIDANGNISGYYDKIHLAPFGEYVPLSNLIPFVRKVVPSIGGIQPGNTPKIFAVNNRKFGPLICFEVLFGPMAEHLRAMGADMLVVINNLGWFGQSNAIPEELEIARVRAVETRLPLVQSANTGISGVFDPWGRFTVIDCAFTPSGNVVSYRGSISPEDTIRQRMFGAIKVPLPAKRLIPDGPRIFPWLALAGSLILVVSTFLARRSATPFQT